MDYLYPTITMELFRNMYDSLQESYNDGEKLDH